MKFYIAGPMTNIPQFNIPMFDRAAAKLRMMGYDIVSPAELDSPEMRAIALQSPDGKMGPHEKMAGETWADVLARDVKVITDQVDGGVIVLPGWYKSRGARLEVFVSLLNGKHKYGCYAEENGHPPVVWVQAWEIRQILRNNMP
jgi:hypothetical protein